jgi:hypothetical protein
MMHRKLNSVSTMVMILIQQTQMIINFKMEINIFMLL